MKRNASLVEAPGGPSDAPFRRVAPSQLVDAQSAQVANSSPVLLHTLCLGIAVQCIQVTACYYAPSMYLCDAVTGVWRLWGGAGGGGGRPCARGGRCRTAVAAAAGTWIGAAAV
jgi:hypothetical protein